MKKFLFSGFILLSSLFASEDSFQEFAKVTYSEPMYEYVYDRDVNQECREVRYRVRDNDGYRSNYNDSLGVDTLVGTAAGAVLGSQIGKGGGRVAAQIIGGLLGARVANDIRNNRVNDGYYDNYRYETRTECYEVPSKTKSKVITGYKNYFVYNGVEYYKISDRPLNRVEITHIINF